MSIDILGTSQVAKSVLNAGTLNGEGARSCEGTS